MHERVDRAAAAAAGQVAAATGKFALAPSPAVEERAREKFFDVVTARTLVLLLIHAFKIDIRACDVTTRAEEELALSRLTERTAPRLYK